MSRSATTPGVVAAPHFLSDGFQILPGLLPEDRCETLVAELTSLFALRQSTVRIRLGGLRNLLRLSPAVAELANSPAVVRLLASLTGRDVFPVRAVFFDKTPDANWRVPWHQDLTIAVEERVDVPGFTGWSVKDGVLHVHPPASVLAEMVTLRVHLDACDADNGALKVIPGSHRNGRLASGDVQRHVEGKACVTCEIARGGAMVMRPLLLHASAPAALPSHRRVLHIEYAAGALPGELRWLDR